MSNIGIFPVPVITRREVVGAATFMRGLRLLFVSDVHLRKGVSRDRLEALIDFIAAQRADMLLLGGDYAESPADCKRFFSALSRVTCPLGGFGVPGNNDLMSADRLEEWMRLGHIRLLKNEFARLRLDGGTLEVGGCDDHRYGRPRTRHLFTGDERVYRILLSHFPVAADCACELQLSGHTHGGQICLGRLSPYSIGFERRFGIRAVRGEAMIGHTRLMVCNGIGISRIPLRLGAPPEMLLVEFV